MPKHFYFTIVSHLIAGKPYILRLVVQRNSKDVVLDHYFEYGSIQDDRLTLNDSIWSIDPDALIDHMPRGEQFHATMDVRLFLRTDLKDALDGSLMADDMEIVLTAPRSASSPAYA